MTYELYDWVLKRWYMSCVAYDTLFAMPLFVLSYFSKSAVIERCKLRKWNMSCIPNRGIISIETAAFVMITRNKRQPVYTWFKVGTRIPRYMVFVLLQYFLWIDVFSMNFYLLLYFWCLYCWETLPCWVPTWIHVYGAPDLLTYTDARCICLCNLTPVCAAEPFFFSLWSNFTDVSVFI